MVYCLIIFINHHLPADAASAETFKMVMEQMKTEMQTPALAQCELLVSYLKIFLIALRG